MRLRRFAGLFALLLFLIASRAAAAGIDLMIRHFTLPDGVEKWEVSADGTNKPVFFAMYENLIGRAVDQEDLPFKRSIAFLVGIGDYDHLKKLPGAAQDLRRVREYLLYRGGFDIVYQVRDHTATEELIKRYMTLQFPHELGSYDRLLFYYSGHGGHQVKDFNFFQMAAANSGDFTDNVLDTKDLVGWSRLLGNNNHVLFLLDSCSVNVDFTPRADLSVAREGKTLKEAALESSRIVMAASSERGLTYEGEEGGFFTRALIDTLEVPQTGVRTSYLTSNEVFSQVRRSVIKKGKELGIGMEPQRIPLLSDEHRGEFLFLYPQQARAVQGQTAKGKVLIRVAPWGEVRIFPLNRSVKDGSILELPTGEYEARIVNPALEMELVKVFTVQAGHLTEIRAKFPVQVEEMLREHGLTDVSGSSPDQP